MNQYVAIPTVDAVNEKDLDYPIANFVNGRPVGPDIWDLWDTDPRLAYLEWLTMEARLLRLELWPGSHSARGLAPCNTFASGFHFPMDRSWNEMPPPSSRAETVLRAVGVQIPGEDAAPGEPSPVDRLIAEHATALMRPCETDEELDTLIADVLAIQARICAAPAMSVADIAAKLATLDGDWDDLLGEFAKELTASVRRDAERLAAG
ncbi:MAG TPA: hypothetical protein VHD15_15555 [Hyphomicrobiales bacterium]|nr:hypothetical protein [Hyphomicrobiales bacterium]